MSPTSTRFGKVVFSILASLLVSLTQVKATTCTATDAATLASCNADTVIISGTVNITGNVTLNANVKTLLITATGVLNFSANGNYTLTLPAGAKIRILSGGQLISGQCNGNKKIVIGTTEVANCNGSNSGGQTKYSFAQLMTGGGTLAVNPTYTGYCAGGTLNLFANRTGGVGGYTYSWTGPASFTSTLENPTRTPGVAGTYNLTVTDAFNNTTATGSVTVVEATQIAFTSQPAASTNYTLGQSASPLTVSTSGGVAPVTYQWYSNTTNSYTGATAISGATSTSYTPSTAAAGTTYYFVTASSNGVNCTAANSNIARVIVSDNKTWTGAISTDWNTAGNWSPSGVPNSGSIVTIPATANQPILSTAVTVLGLYTQPSTSLDLNGFNLTINDAALFQGTIIGSSGSDLRILNQNINTNLAFAQALDNQRTLQNLYISGTGTVTLTNLLIINFNNGTVDIEGGGTLAANGNLRISSFLSTAFVKNLGDNGGGNITGDVIVERHYTGSYGRKWRLTNAAVKGSTNNSIYYNWQNNGVVSNFYGAEIWGPRNIVGIGVPSTNPTGYASGPNPGSFSIKGVNNVTGMIDTVPSTKNAGTLFNATTPIPYFLFPTSPFKDGAGRIVYTSGSEQGILRATGNLVIGNQVYNHTATDANKCFLVPNPYASRVDFALLGKTNLLNRIWVWDPALTGTNGVGAYQLVDLTTNTVTPGGGSYTSFRSTIESGQAYFIETATNGAVSLTYTESAKVDGPEVRIMGASKTYEGLGTVYTSPDALRIKANLLDPSQSNAVLDGIMVQFEKDGNLAIDGNDALKFPNSGENLAIMQGKEALIVERRPMPTIETTVPLQISRMQGKTYTLAVAPAVAAYGHSAKVVLADKFLNTTTTLSSEEPLYYSFAVNSDIASSNDRFVIKAVQTRLPFSIADETVAEGDNGTRLSFAVNNEFFQTRYKVESSRNGDLFVTELEGDAKNHGAAGAYALDLPKRFKGKTYFRVSFTDDEGNIILSKVVTTVNGEVKVQPHTSITMYPNPVKSSASSVSFNEMAAGKYTIKIVGADGQVFSTQTVEHSGNNQNYRVMMPLTLRRGKYVLQVSGAGMGYNEGLNFIKE